MQIVPDWWQSYLAGELAGLGAMIEAYQRRVFAVALATVVDPCLAEDVVQETFIAAHAHRTEVRSPEAVGAWLAAVARNRGRDLMRTHRREALTHEGELEVEGGASPAAEVEAAALRSELSRALARIPLSLREPLILYYAHDCSAELVARELGVSETAALQRLSRGRKLMRRYAAALEDYVRPSKALGAAVLALLGLRVERAHASPLGRARAPVFAVGAAILMAGFATTLADGRSRPPATGLAASDREEVAFEREARTSSRAVASERESSRAVASERASSRAVASERASSRAVASERASSRAVASERASSRPVSEREVRASSLAAEADRDANARAAWTPRAPASEPVAPPAERPGEPALRFEPSVAPAAEASLGAVATVAVAARPAPADAHCACAAPRRAPRWQPANGFVENAALPPRGDVDFEMIGVEWLVRAGLGEHVAAHAAFMPLQTHTNANPAFGGGLKIGGHLAERLALAAVGEAVREVRFNTLSVGDAWIGRAYASLTFGDSLTNVTASAGVVAYDDGAERQVVPVLALGSQVAYDERLGLVAEMQWFPRPLATLSQTTTLAVRFRREEDRPSLLGIRRARIDVGSILIDRTDADLEMAPWIQVGLGW